MLRDTVPFSEFWRTRWKDSSLRVPLASLVRFIEQKLGGEMIYDVAKFPFARPDLADLFELAEALKRVGVVRTIWRQRNNTDEPPTRSWHTVFREGKEQIAGGISLDDDRAALTAALAESIERHIWFEKTDHFRGERQATAHEIQRFGEAFLPESFSSFTEKTRQAHPRLALRDAPYQWVLGKRLPQETPVYIPAQVISNAPRIHNRRHEGEPIILFPITTGIATWPTREGAILRGMLELIERDAYMITWLNHLSPARFDLERLCEQRPSLARAVARCRKYRIEPHIVRLVTDAPTYAVCAVLQDLTGNVPVYSHGLKAGPDPARAAEAAILEAIRGQRVAIRQLSDKKPDEKPLTIDDVGHFYRLRYWAEENRHTRLEFLHAGPVRTHEEAWESDSESEHLKRLYDWIKERGYNCAAVSLTGSSSNASPWYIEFVVIPELQQMHFNERLPNTGGKRLKEVPRRCGFKPRDPFYLDDPHPFA